VRTLRRPLTIAAAAAAAALTLSGCTDTNFGAQTNQQYQPAVGANYRGDIDVLNTLLVANPNGTATVSAGVVNQNDTSDTITDVTATTLAGAPLSVAAPETSRSLPSKQGITLGAKDTDSAYVVTDAPIGQYVRLTITFSSSTAAVIEAPVVTRGEIYQDVALS
jgi:hypothetical protein